jgi:hypothetical protein
MAPNEAQELGLNVGAGAGGGGVLGRTVDECRERAAEAIAVHTAGLEADGDRFQRSSGRPKPSPRP